jgi:endoglucanase
MILSANFTACPLPGHPETTMPAPVETTVQPVKLAKKAPFTKGFNLDKARTSQNLGDMLSQIYQIYTLGADVVRVPTDFFSLMNNAGHKIPDKVLDNMQRAFDTVEEHYPMHVIIDNHSVEADYKKVNGAFPISYEALLTEAWRQIATRFSISRDFVIYEIQNEPWVVDWHAIQNRVIEAIRAIDASHAIVIVENNLQDEYEYNYDNLIFTAHMYTPFLYTHQGSWWTSDYSNIQNMPWPAGSEPMPAPPGDQYVERYEKYKNSDGVNIIANELNSFVNYANARNLPLFVGEWGAIAEFSSHSSRVRYYEYCSRQMAIRGIARIHWGYLNEFTPFKQDVPAPYIFQTDIDDDVVKVMGYSPPKKVSVNNFDAFVLYDDYLNFTKDGDCYVWNTDGQEYNFRNTDSKSGVFALSMAHGTGEIRPKFIENRRIPDFVKLLENDYKLAFSVKTDLTDIKYDLSFRFYNADINWAHKVVNVETDGAWHEYEIPLKSFECAVGFSWECVAACGFISGNSNVLNVKIDDISLLR